MPVLSEGNPLDFEIVQAADLQGNFNLWQDEQGHFLLQMAVYGKYLLQILFAKRKRGTALLVKGARELFVPITIVGLREARVRS